MTQADVALATEIFGPPCEELADVRTYCNGAVSVDLKTSRYSTIIEVDGEGDGIFGGNLEELNKTIKENGSGDWLAALTRQNPARKGGGRKGSGGRRREVGSGRAHSRLCQRYSDR